MHSQDDKLTDDPTEVEVKQALQQLPEPLLLSLKHVATASYQGGLLIKNLQDSLGINNSTASVYLLQLIEPARGRVDFPLIHRIQRQGQGDYGAYRYYLMSYVNESMIDQAIEERNLIEQEIDQAVSSINLENQNEFLVNDSEVQIAEISYTVQRLILEVRDLKIREQKQTGTIAQLVQQTKAQAKMIQDLTRNLLTTTREVEKQKQKVNALQRVHVTLEQAWKVTDESS